MCLDVYKFGKVVGLVLKQIGKTKINDSLGHKITYLRTIIFFTFNFLCRVMKRKSCSDLHTPSLAAFVTLHPDCILNLIHNWDLASKCKIHWLYACSCNVHNCDVLVIGARMLETFKVQYGICKTTL